MQAELRFFDIDFFLLKGHTWNQKAFLSSIYIV